MRRTMILSVSVLALVGVLATFAGLNRITPTTEVAQAATPAAQFGALVRTITVVGRGTVQAKPDMAEATLGVQALAPQLSDAFSKANTDMERVISKLKAEGIAEKDIQTTGFHINLERDREGKHTGFRVANTVRVKIRDLSKVGSTLDAVVNAGANTVHGIRFTLSDPAAAQGQARAAAMANAKARAAELAAAGGVGVGEIVQISETISGPPPVTQAFGGREMAMAASAPPIESGELDVTAQVQVVYGVR